MKLIIAFGMGILHRDFRAEFNVRPDGFTEILVVGKTRRVESCHVELDKPLSLLLGDPKISVHIDEMHETEFPGEAVRTTEGFDREGSEVIDMLRLAGPEEWLKHRVFEDAAVEGVLETVQCRLAAREFVERGHPSTIGTGMPRANCPSGVCTAGDSDLRQCNYGSDVEWSGAFMRSHPSEVQVAPVSEVAAVTG
jgi:hypothetical protein